MATKRVCWAASVFGCLVCFAVVLLPTILPAVGVFEPFRRAFFCHDKELSYPKKPDTVSFTVLMVFAIILPLGIIAVVEAATRKAGSGWCATLRRGFVRYGICLLFMAVCASATYVIKYTVGEHRPYFLTVCRVNDSFSCEPGTLVEEDVCTGDPGEIRQARLSFPSGHSSFSVCTAVILILYLQHTVTKRAWVVPRVMVQALLLYTAAFVSCSRVMDNAHHLRDVVGGCVLGTVVGVAGFLTMVTATGTKDKKMEQQTEDAAKLIGVTKRPEKTRHIVRFN